VDGGVRGGLNLCEWALNFLQEKVLDVSSKVRVFSKKKGSYFAKKSFYFFKGPLYVWLF